MKLAANVIPHRILVVDDNADIHADFSKILLDMDDQAGRAVDAAEAALLGTPVPEKIRAPLFDVDCALQGKDAVALVLKSLSESRPYSVAFIDMRMPPGWDGAKTMQEIWAIDPALQIVVCSAYSEYDWEALVGLFGYLDKLLILRKPFEASEVLQCATALSRKWQNEMALYHNERALRHLATHDVLTGLPNRAILEDRLSLVQAQSDRAGNEFALLILDLDRFKLVNDSMGHRAGDELLREVSRRLNEVVRASDTLVRLGGDEFVIIVSTIRSREFAEDIARRVIEALGAPVQVLGVEVRTSGSVGIAIYPSDGKTAEVLMAHADAAMYAAKQAGRGVYRCFNASMGSSAQDRVNLERELYAALTNSQLELHYQPKIDAATGCIASAEALIRWRHPERGLLAPAAFIPFAEECGLLNVISNWVIREACRQAREWQQQGLPRVRIAVNLSASQFRMESLLQTFQATFAEFEVEPSVLEVELTETAVMSDAEDSVRILQNLTEMGVRVSIDDFGTGYSSMSYLRRFPIDTLKIDRTFIAEVTTRSEDASIVRAIISLAHSLNLRVVAEGVETQEQVSFLQSLECDQYQGYYFSAALQPTDFAKLLRSAACPEEIGPLSATRQGPVPMKG